MIIFYTKTGQIIGTIEGRIHSKAHLKMWVGDKDTTERLVVNWKRKEGTLEYEPDHKQKEIFVKLDKNPRAISAYKVDVKTKELVSK